jgi:diketogulonate reductase-like aldo/keto reductase
MEYMGLVSYACCIFESRGGESTRGVSLGLQRISRDAMNTIPEVSLPSGERVPALGLGTWRMGERAGARKEEVAALQAGIELGLTLIDTAEMYGEGGAEQVVAEAARGRRDQLFIVSKVYPHNASRKGVPAACERSLKRLQSDRIDLYLLHWRGSYALAETVEAFEKLREAGKIRHWGVSNLDDDDMQELFGVPNGEACATNQVLYNLSRRGIEFSLLPMCRERGMPVMAYSPIEQGRILRERALVEVAKRHDASAAQIALAWLLAQPQVMVIPKASDVRHVRENRASAQIVLTKEDHAALDRAFAPPARREPLAML